jgi:hypothetical protein
MKLNQTSPQQQSPMDQASSPVAEISPPSKVVIGRRQPNSFNLNPSGLVVIPENNSEALRMV